MRRTIRIWTLRPWVVISIALISFAVGIGLDRLALRLHQEIYHPNMRRDLNDLASQLMIGDTREYVTKQFGDPGMVANSLAELEGEPYRLTEPSGEDIMIYYEYPWGIIIYIDKKTRLSAESCSPGIYNAAHLLRECFSSPSVQP